MKTQPRGKKPFEYKGVPKIVKYKSTLVRGKKIQWTKDKAKWEKLEEQMIAGIPQKNKPVQQEFNSYCQKHGDFNDVCPKCKPPQDKAEWKVDFIKKFISGEVCEVHEIVDYFESLLLADRKRMLKDLVKSCYWEEAGTYDYNCIAEKVLKIIK